jgi:hypothetical protein
VAKNGGGDLGLQLVDRRKKREGRRRVGSASAHPWAAAAHLASWSAAAAAIGSVGEGSGHRGEIAPPSFGRRRGELAGLVFPQVDRII